MSPNHTIIAERLQAVMLLREHFKCLNRNITIRNMFFLLAKRSFDPECKSDYHLEVLAHESGASLDTARSNVNQLVDEGHVKMTIDPRDKRKKIVSLSQEAADGIEKILGG